MATDGKIQIIPDKGLYIRCRCGLIFIGNGMRMRWSAHTYECDNYEKVTNGSTTNKQ